MTSARRNTQVGATIGTSGTPGALTRRKRWLAPWFIGQRPLPPPALSHRRILCNTLAGSGRIPTPRHS